MFLDRYAIERARRRFNFAEVATTKWEKFTHRLRGWNVLFNTVTDVTHKCDLVLSRKRLSPSWGLCLHAVAFSSTTSDSLERANDAVNRSDNFRKYCSEAKHASRTLTTAIIHSNIWQGILLTAKAITMPTFPISLSSLLTALSPVFKKGHGKDWREQTKENSL